MNTTETMRDPSDPESPPRDLRRDVGGLALFALAIFLGVSVAMAARRPEPDAGGTTALVTGLVGWLGVWPLIVLSACLGLLGARLWIAGALAGLGRNALWSLGLCLAVSMLLGAASYGAGGDFGNFSGGNLTGVLSAWLGVPISLIVVAAVVWFAWLQPPEWKPALSPGEPAPSIFTPTDSEGLTADEAEALLPDEPPMAPVTGRSIPVAPDLPPLYPPDVRREGRIPEGARPLEARDEPATRPEAEPAARPQLAHAAAGVAGEPVAEPARGLAHQVAPLSVQPPAEPAATLAAGPAVEDLAPAVPRWERPRHLTPAAPAVAEEASPSAPPPAGAGFILQTSPVRSAWEVEDDEQDDEQDDERDEAVETSDEELDLEEDGEEPELAAADDEAAEEFEESESELDADEEEASGDDLDDESSWSDDVVPAAEAPQEVAEEVAEPAAEELLEAPRAEKSAWEQGGLFDDEPVDAYGTPVTLVEALRQANHQTAARIAEPAPEEDIAEEAAEDSSEEVAEAAADEPQVEIQPQPRPAAARPTEPEPSTPEAADDLLFRAGMLFLERGRVAVSMLQRSFDLDFKEATALLDQLQEAGLIGPYLGGQKRDLLLTAEEWRERRVGAR
jgi:hypothetical protein